MIWSHEEENLEPDWRSWRVAARRASIAADFQPAISRHRSEHDSQPVRFTIDEAISN